MADSRSQTTYETILERQLPQLTKRLQGTLDKFQNPALNSSGISVPADEWWKDVLSRYRDGEILFTATVESNPTLPATLFDTMLENCLENTRKKKQHEPEIQITVRFRVEGGQPRLTITDSGSAIPELAAQELFQVPVSQPRDGGLGIGLFQASRQALQAGYRLSLSENTTGRVSFDLQPTENDQRKLAL